MPSGPDKVEEFKQLQRAYEVLIDPERRKLFDETGECSERPDFANAALALIAQLMIPAVVDCIKQGFNPEEFDLMKYLRDQLSEREFRCEKHRSAAKQFLQKLELVAQRLKVKGDGENVLAAIVRQPLADFQREFDQATQQLDTIVQARKLLAAYEYKCTGRSRGLKGWTMQIDEETLREMRGAFGRGFNL